MITREEQKEKEKKLDRLCRCHSWCWRWLRMATTEILNVDRCWSSTDPAGLHEVAQSFTPGFTTAFLATTCTFLDPVHAKNLEAHAVVAAVPRTRLDPEQHGAVVLFQLGQDQERDVCVFVARRHWWETRLIGFTLFGRWRRCVLVGVFDLQIEDAFVNVVSPGSPQIPRVDRRCHGVRIVRVDAGSP